MSEQPENTSQKFNMLDVDFHVDISKYLKSLIVVFLESLER